MVKNHGCEKHSKNKKAKAAKLERLNSDLAAGQTRTAADFRDERAEVADTGLDDSLGYDDPLAEDPSDPKDPRP